MRYTDFIDGVGILDPAEEHDLFRRLDAGAIADAILAGHFLAAVPVSEAELRRISDDGVGARQTLWRQMLAIVLTQARQAAVSYRCSVEDLIQAGCIGLGEAIERYDVRRGARFSTVAWTWIRRRIGEEVVRLSGARSRSVMREAAEVARIEEELTARWQSVPSSDAIAARMGKDVMLGGEEEGRMLGGRNQFFRAGGCCSEKLRRSRVWAHWPADGSGETHRGAEARF
ncbi:Sigma-70 region 2 [Cutibacterium acnes HL036PA3]|nr:Sigma-70 region 2 [Cutibacterium acnes HL036PA1]EFS60659.1 Sigma-70 region 2 [Cutibacterium acnes HL036PA2]EFS88963.1 Sigma-70 region 2 [Cutibacterium acnes HL036PA3]